MTTLTAFESRPPKSKNCMAISVPSTLEEAAQDNRHRAQARGNHHCGRGAIVPAPSRFATGVVVLLHRRFARWNHCRPRAARRRIGVVRTRPRPARGGGDHGPALTTTAFPPCRTRRQVATLANKLFTSLQPLHGLPLPTGKLLEAAAYLHDVGHYVSDSRSSQALVYLIANSDFARIYQPRARVHRPSLPVPHRKAAPTSNTRTMHY